MSHFDESELKQIISNANLEELLAKQVKTVQKVRTSKTVGTNQKANSQNKKKLSHNHNINLKQAVNTVIKALDQGKLRVANKKNGKWIVNEWIKKAILFYFGFRSVSQFKSGDFSYIDKIPVKQWKGLEKVRVVPPAIARYGSFVSSGAILMPSYINIGAFIGEGSLIDTWATVGSCAQIGAQVHISGGVGIGGVLEPLQASPVIIEDHVFIGSRCIIVEGIIIEEGAVLGAGVTLTESTKIIDVRNSKEQILKGRIPKNSVVIPGSINKNFSAGTYAVPCALIIGQRSESTDRKTSLNAALRDYELSK